MCVSCSFCTKKRGAQVEHVLGVRRRGGFRKGCCFGILPGWYGMENGQKPEMEKKMEIEMENDPKLERGKNGKKMAKEWIFEGVFHYFSIFGPFLGHFCPCPAWGRFPFRFPFFFFPFPAFGRFPCHTSPAGSQVLLQ